jgi:hypothetical protein
MLTEAGRLGIGAEELIVLIEEHDQQASDSRGGVAV